MSTEVRQLEPRDVWQHFADLNAVPRASKREQQVIEFMRQFGESLNLPTSVDAVGNVLIRKPASTGMESCVPVVLQAHLDMVHQKNAATEFDFATEGIRMTVDGDWVRADGTTLGADNGMGVAAIMAVLASDEIAHPPLEALFTIDEETGMTGAQGLEPRLLQGKILLNLDTEEDNELTIGCAGGCDVTATSTYSPQPVGAGDTYELSVRGLTGGHSGVDIHLGRANSNKLLTRLLWALDRECGIQLVSFAGGSLRNALPREATAVLVVPSEHLTRAAEIIEAQSQKIRQEYATTDPDLTVQWSPAATAAGECLPPEYQTAVLASMYACLHGIHRMCPDIPGLVQTSNNLACVKIGDGTSSIMCLTRSSVDTERDDLATAIQACLGQTGADVSITGAYPGWQPAPQSDIVNLMSEIYQELFDDTAHVAACHAGLECGIIGRHYDDLDMISFGPTIRGAHSPDERVQISSVQKFWKYFLTTLSRIPAA